MFITRSPAVLVIADNDTKLAFEILIPFSPYLKTSVSYMNRVEIISKH